MMVVVSYSDDPHAELVEKALAEKGFVDFIRLDLEEAFGETPFIIGSGKWRIASQSRNRTVVPENLVTVWWRRSGKYPTPKSTVPSTEAESSESYWALRWLMESLPETHFPFGHPHRLRLAENKIRQLEVARAVGFRTPDTCISNDKEALVAFCNVREWVVVKPLYLTGTINEKKEELSFYAAPVRSQNLIVELRAYPNNRWRVQCL